MSGIQFGQELKQLRKKVGISSKVLSQKVNKAVTYVSQLERGLIKNPDFNTCYLLLKELGVNEEKIEDILYNHYGIMSPEREQVEIDWHMKRIETEEAEIEADPEGYAQRKYEESLHSWLEARSFELKQSNKHLYNTFNVFIEKDVTRAEKVIANLESLTKDKSKFDFLCSLFENDFSLLDPSLRQNLLEIIAEYMNKTQTNKEDKQ